jgi:hypothetical protein
MTFLSDTAQDFGAAPPGAAPREPKQSSAFDVLREAMRKQHPELYQNAQGMKKGGMTASSRADGCATKGKTKGRFV